MKIPKFGLTILSLLFALLLVPNFSYADSFNCKDIVSITNQERLALGLNTLKESALLSQAAQLKAEHMIENQYFNHNAPTGESSWYWFDKVGYNYNYAGENLATGFYNPESVVKAWMASKTHRENIINQNFIEIGVATVNGKLNGSNTKIIVQLFGKQFPNQLNQKIAYAHETDLNFENNTNVELDKKETKKSNNSLVLIFSLFNMLWLL